MHVRLRQGQAGGQPSETDKFWMGHSVKMFDEVEYRREVADSIGLGFELLLENSIVCSVRRKSVKSEIALAVQVND
jgi:hypothetical protein